MRGNGGGLITAGERILQFFTSNDIEREKFQVKASELTQTLCIENEWLKKWRNSIKLALQNKAPHSQGFPLEEDDEYKMGDLDFEYKKNVVLITDALCYSTTDILAAGFKDNKLGKILGTHENTGAGGANVWTHNFLANHLPAASEIKPFPITQDNQTDCNFRVAIRRSLRVGENDGIPLEDFGVTPDQHHKMTDKDLLEGNVDLIEKAVDMLDNWDQVPA